jgi:hypothetical protein
VTAIPVEWIIGPFGGLALLAIVSKVLWDAHKKSDADLLTDRDFWRSTALKALDHGDKAIDVAASKQANGA